MLAVHTHGSSGLLNDQVAITLLFTVIGILIATATLVIEYLNGRFRRRFIYGVTVSAQMMNASVAHPDLHILWRDEEIADPHILEIDLIYKGRVDIRSSDFDKGRPLILDIHVPIIDILQTIIRPERPPAPQVEAEGTALKIGPDLLRKRQAFKFVLLVDGPECQLECENPIANISEKEARHAAQDIGELLYKNRPSIKVAMTWVALVFVAFYLVTQPANSGHLLNSGFHGLRDAAESLARFVQSLSF